MNVNTKLAIVRFFNAYGLREKYILFKYNKLSFSPRKTPMLISAVDGKRNTQGVTDRFKGIISVYALSKAINAPFKLIYTHPFYLIDFLMPNTYNWIPKYDEISESMSDVRYKILRKQPSIKRLLKVLPLKNQVRVYANLNYLDEINKEFNQNFEWGTLFKELFKPTKELEDAININSLKIGEKYIACVFRFQNLLGDFNEYHSKSVPEEIQIELITKNKKALIELEKSVKLPILVTSDSMKFISEIKDLENIYIFPGKVVHLDCTFNEKKEVYMKSFVDFFMISHAQKVYSIGTKQMYPTEFPVYAAKINNVPFERIYID